MRLVSFASFKGGAGKTTALMAATSGLLQSGKRVALFEGDNNNPLYTWRENAREIGTWDDGIGLFAAHELQDLELAYEEASGAGYEIALFDTRGGDSSDNTSAILNADLVIIPTALTPIDIEYGVKTLQFAVQAMQAAEVTIPAACLLTQTPTGRPKASERKSIEILRQMPQFDTRLGERAAFADMFATGLLHLYHNALLEQPAKRIQAQHTRLALREAAAFAAEMIEAMPEAEGA